MKKILSALAGLSLMAAPMASATASTRPSTAIPMVSSSATFIQDDMDDDSDDRLFILGVMAGAIVLAALIIFNTDEDTDDGGFVGPPVSGA